MIRFGVIGTNWITDAFLQAAKHVEDFQLTAVYSRTEEKGALFAKNHGVDVVFTNIEEMAASDHIDAVYIASPNAFHAEQAMMFLNAKKHVLCEKPLASNYNEVNIMIEVAKKNNVLLMEAVKGTLMPGFFELRNNLHKIGKIRRFLASFCKYSSRYDSYREGTILNAFKPELSNGSLMDLGIYCIYPVVALYGEPKKILANAVMLDSGVDGGGSLILQYDDFEAVLMHSKISDSYIQSEIQGEDGTMIIEGISEPEQLSIRYRGQDSEEINIQTEFPPMYYEVKEFISLIQAGKTESSINSYQNSLITAKIMEEARKQINLEYPADRLKS